MLAHVAWSALTSSGLLDQPMAFRRLVLAEGVGRYVAVTLMRSLASLLSPLPALVWYRWPTITAARLRRRSSTSS